ncbi:hypothetical protein [Achromobacter xylosoxidans]|uniref:hypothetical protein n=1 Tax=Alcaligenes xylosoxydans xylosoxydans TaxID=85698 RepID=UPI00244A7183|nr:hypothetical protein [Achromobacter xylosoxidans]MDH0521705.1 hypothetical protein [Achromobacter xylosoxidans]MDH0545892.1 hypothetical protein [Achromobacter xylosoxidans]
MIPRKSLDIAVNAQATSDWLIRVLTVVLPPVPGVIAVATCIFCCVMFALSGGKVGVLPWAGFAGFIALAVWLIVYTSLSTVLVASLLFRRLRFGASVKRAVSKNDVQAD